MNTNALNALGFYRTDGDAYERTMMLDGEKVIISVQPSPVCDGDWGISFNYEEIHEIENVDEILDWVASYRKSPLAK